MTGQVERPLAHDRRRRSESPSSRYGQALRWRARYRDSQGKQHAKHFERRIDAEWWLVEQQSKINRGEWVDPALGKMTVEALAPTWLASKRSLSDDLDAVAERLNEAATRSARARTHSAVAPVVDLVPTPQIIASGD